MPSLVMELAVAFATAQFGTAGLAKATKIGAPIVVVAGGTFSRFRASRVLGLLEILVALSLLSDPTWIASLIGGVILLIFAGGSTLLWLTGSEGSCGCGALVGSRTLGPRHSVTTALTGLLLLLAAAASGTGTARLDMAWRLLLLFWVGAAAFVTSSLRSTLFLLRSSSST